MISLLPHNPPRHTSPSHTRLVKEVIPSFTTAAERIHIYCKSEEVWSNHSTEWLHDGLYTLASCSTAGHSVTVNHSYRYCCGHEAAPDRERDG